MHQYLPPSPPSPVLPRVSECHTIQHRCLAPGKQGWGGGDMISELGRRPYTHPLPAPALTPTSPPFYLLFCFHSAGLSSFTLCCCLFLPFKELTRWQRSLEWSDSSGVQCIGHVSSTTKADDHAHGNAAPPSTFLSLAPSHPFSGLTSIILSLSLYRAINPTPKKTSLTSSPAVAGLSPSCTLPHTHRNPNSSPHSTNSHRRRKRKKHRTEKNVQG